MTGPFAEILKAGEHRNSLGRAEEVVEIVSADRSRLEELYRCIFDDDAWVRMRAIDTVEKVARVHPEWFAEYIDRFQKDLSGSTQPSILWHLAELYGELDLSNSQRKGAIKWLESQLATTDVDWIVSGNAMKTLVKFMHEGFVEKSEVLPLLKIQQSHHSNAIKKRAEKFQKELAST